ncbi:hypothetical protein MUK42_19020 [Musa troglodytarum]|uniref:Uncharacterized protein n=1 Tax=Musa troglodytarum TaxID=320322 RepID=A0A9E7JEI1_9LILI|nr:hypothetical protein MUK42_19020 [Musa troglodytarum]
MGSTYWSYGSRFSRQWSSVTGNLGVNEEEPRGQITERASQEQEQAQAQAGRGRLPCRSRDPSHPSELASVVAPTRELRHVHNRACEPLQRGMRSHGGARSTARLARASPCRHRHRPAPAPPAGTPPWSSTRWPPTTRRAGRPGIARGDGEGGRVDEDGVDVTVSFSVAIDEYSAPFSLDHPSILCTSFGAIPIRPRMPLD